MEQEVKEALEFSLQSLIDDAETSDLENREYYEIVATNVEIDGLPCQVTIKLVIKPNLFLVEDQIYYLDSQPTDDSGD